MTTRLNVDETRTSFDGIRGQIKKLESSIMAVYKNGSGPLGTPEDIEKIVTSAVESLQEGRSEIERLICWYDS